MKLQHTTSIWVFDTNKVHTQVARTLSEVAAFRISFNDEAHEEVYHRFGMGDSLLGVTTQEYREPES